MGQPAPDGDGHGPMTALRPGWRRRRAGLDEAIGHGVGCDAAGPYLAASLPDGTQVRVHVPARQAPLIAYQLGLSGVRGSDDPAGRAAALAVHLDAALTAAAERPDDAAVLIGALAPLAARLAALLAVQPALSAAAVGYRAGAAELTAAPEERECRICGCTQERACIGGCRWVVDPAGIGDLCSACEPLVLVGTPGLSEDLREVADLIDLAASATPVFTWPESLAVDVEAPNDEYGYRNITINLPDGLDEGVAVAAIATWSQLMRGEVEIYAGQERGRSPHLIATSAVGAGTSVTVQVYPGPIQDPDDCAPPEPQPAVSSGHLRPVGCLDQDELAAAGITATYDIALAADRYFDRNGNELDGADLVPVPATPAAPEPNEQERSPMSTGEAGVPVPSRPTGDAIHQHFGLSYSNYLVLPRTLLQSMPDAWQRDFVALLDQLSGAFAHVPQAEAYIVQAAAPREVAELDEDERALLGITERDVQDERDQGREQFLGHGGEQCYLDREGEPLSGQDTVLVPAAEPVAPYNRGRTYIPPRIDGPAGLR